MLHFVLIFFSLEAENKDKYHQTTRREREREREKQSEEGHIDKSYSDLILYGI